MKSTTRLVIAVVAVIFAVATLCPAQDVKPTDLGKGAAFNGKKIEIEDRDKGQGRGRLPPVFHGGERVRGHHGRREEYRRAPFRLRLIRR